MNGAELKAILKDGGRVFGTMLSLSRNPRWLPVLDGVGLDYAVIDTEHGARSRGELGDFLTMMNTTGVVRPRPWHPPRRTRRAALRTPRR